MLFILLLLASVGLCFFFYRKTRQLFFQVLTVIIFILFILESIVYAYFIFQVYEAKGIYLIGNQSLLDSLYKIRLIYAVYYRKGREDSFFTIDDELGYSPGRNKKTNIYTSNNCGFRGNKEYSLIPQEGTLRIACFGDSFVFCDDEKDEDTWENYLENSVGNLEVLNFGVPGYGMVQAYLRYLKDGLRFFPNIIFTNRVMWSDYRDTVNYLYRINKNLMRVEFYRVKTRFKDGLLLNETISVFNLFDPKWREKNIYNELPFYKGNKFLESKLLSFSNVALFAKVSYIKYLILKMPKSSKPGMLKFNLKLLENYSKVVKKNESIMIFIDHYGLDYYPKEIQDFFKENSDHIRYFNISNSFFGKMKDGDIISKNFTNLKKCYDKECKRKNRSIAESTLRMLRKNKVLNYTNHYNKKGNKMYAEAVLEILKENEWHTGNKVFYYNKYSNSFLCRDRQVSSLCSKLE